MSAQDWQVHLLSDMGDVKGRSAALAFMAGFIYVAILLLVAFFIQSRRYLKQALEYQAQAQQALRYNQQRLESHVEERTADLVATNKLLDHEVQANRHAQRELCEAQGELVQAAKLAAIGHLSTGIVHELNQPLAAIQSYTDSLKVLLARKQYTNADGVITSIGELTERMAHFTRQLKTFARKSNDDAETICAARALRYAVALMARTKPDDVEIVAVIPEGELLIEGDSIRLEQVFLNLLKNAVDAVHGQTIREVHVSVESTATSISVRIEDTGPGMPESVRSQIFEPFFTTKKSGEGLGLGLSISFGIINECGGTITATNRADGGALFAVELPRVALKEEQV